MNAIAVVDRNWGLGRDGKLLVHLPGDLKYFKEKTLGKTIIIGRGTYESMAGKLLSGRDTIIMTRNENFKAPCAVAHSLEEALRYLKNIPGENQFAAGGETVYNMFFPYCDTFFITKMDAVFAADRHFPNLDSTPSGFTVKSLSGVMEENGVEYQFFEYKRIK